MRTLLIILASTASTMLADTYNVTLSDVNEDARFKAAVGSIMGYRDVSGAPRSATLRECNYFLGTYMTGTIQDYERRQNQASFTPAPINPSPAPPGTAAAKAT